MGLLDRLGPRAVLVPCAVLHAVAIGALLAGGLRRLPGAVAPRARRRALGCALLATALLAGCGDDRETADGTLPPRVAAPATLLADGTVPWVDERAGEAEVSAVEPRAARPSADGVPACRAAQLRGALGRWRPKLARDDFGKVLRHDGLIGLARVRNRSRTACRLRGEVPTRLLVAGRPLAISTSHGLDEEGRERATLVRPGGEAILRLDWSSPFCGRARGSQALGIALPEGGGELIAPVRRPTRPPCFASETQPARRSVLAASAFDAPPLATRLDSPLNRLRARIRPGAPVPAGDVLTYHVVLSNPTGRAVSLRPCPGYEQSRYSTAAGPGQDAVNDARLYRLNCRPVRVIAAGGRRRFEMKVRVPAGMASGRPFSVAWALKARGVAGGGTLNDGFRVVVP